MLDPVLCTCGSGLRQTRCCGLDPAALPTATSLELLNPLANEATSLFNDKKHREAETLALKILDLAPNHRMALRVLFELRKAENRHPATEMLARRLAGLPTGNPAQATAANLQLAQLLINQGRHAEAEPSSRIALQNSPRDPAAHHVLGVIFTETGQLKPGEQHYRRALKLREPEPPNHETGTLLANLAWNLKLQARPEEAAATYERALALRPDNARAAGGYAQVEAALGQNSRAAARLDAALTRWPADRSLRLLRALTHLQQNQPEAVLALLNDPPEKLLPAELIARGQAFERLGQTANAVIAYASAKTLQRERYNQRYQPASFLEKAQRYKEFFSSAQLAAMPRATLRAAPQPIFLLGFPGSGVSLLEQLLANIPDIASAGDLAPIAALTGLPELANYPDCLTDTLIGDGETLPDRLAARYLQTLNRIASPDHKCITSRAASDVWHLGLIKLLFPSAPIIHLIRHPLDVIATNFARDKKLEANCNVSLAALAQHYDLTMSLIRHYRSQLTLRYLPVRYEDLVNNPETTLATLLDFIGAPGHPMTYESIHTRGIFRHRAFEAAAPNPFTEIRPTLTPWIEELGYSP